MSDSELEILYENIENSNLRNNLKRKRKNHNTDLEAHNSQLKFHVKSQANHYSKHKLCNENNGRITSFGEKENGNQTKSIAQELISATCSEFPQNVFKLHNKKSSQTLQDTGETDNISRKVSTNTEDSEMLQNISQKHCFAAENKNHMSSSKKKYVNQKDVSDSLSAMDLEARNSPASDQSSKSSIVQENMNQEKDASDSSSATDMKTTNSPAPDQISRSSSVQQKVNWKEDVSDSSSATDLKVLNSPPFNQNPEFSGVQKCLNNTTKASPSKRQSQSTSTGVKSPVFKSPCMRSGAEKIKLSPHLSRHPKKFSVNGSPANSKKNSMLFSRPKNSANSPGCSPPMTFMRNKRFPAKSLDKMNVKRKLNFSSPRSKLSSSGSNVSASGDRLPAGDLDPTSSNSDFPPLGYREGYILREFSLHIIHVLGDKTSENLLSEEEQSMIQTFLGMDPDCKDFYARMHHRKHMWNRLYDIKYDSAVEDNLNILKEKGLLSTDIQTTSVEVLFNLLKMPEVRDLCKSLGIKCSVSNKKNYLEEVLRYVQSQRTLGLDLKIVSCESTVKKRIGDLLGPCFILCLEPRSLFRRIHLLFNMKFNRSESVGKKKDLFEIQYMGTARELYPASKSDGNVTVFSSREELLRYQEAEELQEAFSEAVDAKTWANADRFVSIARDNFHSELNGDPSSVSASQIPLCLRTFSPGTIYARILFNGVDVQKKLNNQDQALKDLEMLLQQTTYLPHHRGEWYEKKIVIHQARGQVEEVAKIICSGMSDSFVEDKYKYLMSCRCEKLLKRKKKAKNKVLPVARDLLQSIVLFPPLKCPEPVTIKAKALEGKTGYKRVYVQDDRASGEKTFSSVEELVKSHYCPRHYSRGIHAENSIAVSLFGILLWDIIYECDVPCAFISPYQAKPLDLSSGDFYKHRKGPVDEKFMEMEGWTDEEISSWVRKIWDSQNGKASLVHWNWFRSADCVLDIISCIGWKVVIKICERYAKKYRTARSGFPDLFLWTPGRKNWYKFVEVKGPNDTLGANQKLWMDFLLEADASVELCFVVASGSKTLASTVTEEHISEQKDVITDELVYISD